MKCEFCGKTGKLKRWKIFGEFKFFCRSGHYKKWRNEELKKMKEEILKRRKAIKEQKRENWNKWIEKRKSQNLPYKNFEERF